MGRNRAKEFMWNYNQFQSNNTMDKKGIFTHLVWTHYDNSEALRDGGLDWSQGNPHPSPSILQGGHEIIDFISYLKTMSLDYPTSNVLVLWSGET